MSNLKERIIETLRQAISKGATQPDIRSISFEPDGSCFELQVPAPEVPEDDTVEVLFADGTSARMQPSVDVLFVQLEEIREVRRLATELAGVAERLDLDGDLLAVPFAELASTLITQDLAVRGILEALKAKE